MNNEPSSTGNTSPATSRAVINLSSFEGRPVDTLLARLPPGIQSYSIVGSHDLRVADLMFTRYTNGVSVAIHVKTFTHMDPHVVNTTTPMQNWDVTLYRKENIAYTVIFNGSTCINGCENAFR